MPTNRNTYNNRRKKRPKRNSFPKSLVAMIAIVLISLGAIYAFSRSDSSATTESAPRTYGSCLETVVIPDDVLEIKIEYTGFTISFNPAHHQPNYAVWELTAEKADGQLPRNSKFRPDTEILGSATLEDYRNSGFDRGHMAPAGDFKWNAEAMLDSHFLTNISPQDHSINSGRWSSLEQKCRTWARRDSAIIIVTGPVLTDELTRTIGPNHVSVPERFFKVILAPYANPPRTIGFIVPNSPTPDGLEAMTVSVDQVEEITGFDFFSCLPDDIEDKIEAVANYRQWNVRKR